MTQQMTQTNGGGNGQIAVAKDLRSFLNGPAVMAKLAEVANSAMKPEDLIRLALMAASRSPELMKCTQASILRALIDAAELGIKPGGMNGRGYLVPRYNKNIRGTEACFDPGWRGLIDIARRSGQVDRIESVVVYEQDTFEVIRDPFTSVRHIPSEAKDPGPVRASYAVAGFKNGGPPQVEIVYRRDIDKIQNVSASKGGPWGQWYSEMARKTAVRRLCKYLPFDPILDRALHNASEAEHEDERVQVPSGQTPSKRLASKLRERTLAPSDDSMLPDMSVVEDAEIDAQEEQRSGSSSTPRRPDETSDGEPPDSYPSTSPELGDAYEGPDK